MADVATIQSQLDEARAALHSLMTGKQTVQVEYDGRKVQYSMTSADSLRAYIRDLEQQLAVASGERPRRRALRVTF